MGRSYYTMAFKNKAGERKSQPNNKTTGKFLNASIMTLQIFVVNPNFNIIPITNDDSPYPDKKSCYNPDPLLAVIYASSENSVSNFTIHYDPLQLIVLTSDDTNLNHYINKYNPGHVRVKRGYIYRKNNGKICLKKNVLLI